MPHTRTPGEARISPPGYPTKASLRSVTHKVDRQNIHLAPGRQAPEFHTRALEDGQETKASVCWDERRHNNEDDEDTQVRPPQPTLQNRPSKRAEDARTRGEYTNQDEGRGRHAQRRLSKEERRRRDRREPYAAHELSA